MSNQNPIIRLSECSVTRMSPDPWKECIVDVDTSRERVFVLSDEACDGNCLIELPGVGEEIVWRIRLSEFRELLDLAEKKLIGE